MTPAQLTRLRTQLSLTQEALADQLGVTRNSVVRWEMGKYPISARTERALQLLQQQSGLGRGPKQTEKRKPLISKK